MFLRDIHDGVGDLLFLKLAPEDINYRLVIQLFYGEKKSIINRRW